MRRARREGGVAVWTSLDGHKTERATFTCRHCNAVVIIPARAKAEDCGGWCACCMGPVCTKCAGKGCTPFEQQLERYEKSQLQSRRLREAMERG